jgi:type IV pilus assembly protein PilQ
MNMITTSTHLRGRSPRQTRRWLATLACGAIALYAQSALAASALKDVTYDTQPGGKVELRMTFDSPPPSPKVFTTGTPPRIAVDFADTTNGFSTRHIDIGKGATSGVSVVGAGGRTRVVVELFREAAYVTRVEGNTLVMEVSNGPTGATTTTAVVTDPTKVAPSAGNGPGVSNIDFRRGQNGEGRIIVSLTGTGVNPEMHKEGDRVLVSLGHANLPAKLAQRLDVLDFATPVQSVNTTTVAGGARMEIRVKGEVETSAYQTANEYVVEVAPKKAAPVDGKLAKGQEPVYSGNRVTFNFQDIPVRSALQLIADISGLNLVASDSVSGSVTLRLVNVPWDQALDVVLRAKSLDKRRSGNVVWIAPQVELANYEQSIADAREKAENNAELVSDYVPISYGKAADIAKLLTQGSLQSQGGGSSSNSSRGFLSSRGSVSYDERTNTLLINDSPEKIRELRELIGVLDRPVQQVLIESRIVVATDTFSRDLGVRWGVQAFQHSASGRNVVGTTPDLTNGTSGSTTGLGTNSLVTQVHNIDVTPVAPGAAGPARWLQRQPAGHQPRR